ncbi:putative glycosyl transferase [Mycobacterium ulcerans str. Harvey]|uniref:Glycosyl transferase n=1 Tax=Mycobacterium ulcerans str. Harvey TaxID=1299332 RepID=A0ABN0QKT0_MYCUL|nr:putative glycosyl transferase [Mycobacterium ulcerans str. Harvey]
MGTTKVLPLGGGRHARAWFACYDLLHRLGGSYAIQIAKRWLFPELRFDEHLIIGEDLLLIKQARKLGKFFYVPTDTVYTSTRRFDTVGTGGSISSGLVRNIAAAATKAPWLQSHPIDRFPTGSIGRPDAGGTVLDC